MSFGIKVIKQHSEAKKFNIENDSVSSEKSCDSDQISQQRKISFDKDSSVSLEDESEEDEGS